MAMAAAGTRYEKCRFSSKTVMQDIGLLGHQENGEWCMSMCNSLKNSKQYVHYHSREVTGKVT